MEHGDIFSRKAGTKMTEEVTQEEDFVEIKSFDEDGNLVVTKVY